MAKTDFLKYLVNKPQMVAGFNQAAKHITALQLMSGTLVPEAKYNIEFAWVTGIPQPNPLSSIHAHDYNEVILFIGGDCHDPENLGAELQFSLGNQVLSINSTGSVFVPAGVPHGQSTWKRVSRPLVKISIGIDSGVKKNTTPKETAKSIDYSRYQVKKPAYEVVAGTPVKGRQGPSSMTFMNNNLVPGSNIYVEGGWVFGMPDPNPHIFEHVHDYEEMVIHYGSDFEQPLELGSEIEFCVGGQPLKIDKTSAVFVPSGVKHGPLTWKKYLYPHLEMAIMPGAGTLDEADPGGHREKAKRSKDNG